MKIAFTTSGDDIGAPLDPRFGRAPKFLIYALETGTYELVDNRQQMNAAQGAGVQAAETVAKHGVDALVTGHCGPKAFQVLDAAGVNVFHCSAATVEDALTEFRAGLLTKAKSADVEGHWA